MSYKSHNDTPLDSLSIDIAKDTKELSDTSNLSSSLQDILSSIYASLKETYTKGYKYHYLSLQLDSNALILILLIPQIIPKVFKEVYKNYEYKDYGIGKYHYLYNSCTHIMLDIQDYTQVGLAHNPSNATILTLHTPYKAQRLELQLANGLDSLIESKDRARQAKLTREARESQNSQQDKRHNTDITSSHIESKQKDSQNNTKQIIDSLLTLKIINGGYKERYWSYGEEDAQANLLHTTEKIDKDSKTTQENKEKQILEIYFSYGKEYEKVEQNYSKCQDDLNLHIITENYNDGELIELHINIEGENMNIQGRIQNNEIVIKNIFKNREMWEC